MSLMRKSMELARLEDPRDFMRKQQKFYFIVGHVRSGLGGCKGERSRGVPEQEGQQRMRVSRRLQQSRLRAEVMEQRCGY